jgi:hypothetical protein
MELPSNLQQSSDAWHESCHICGKVDHFRELEYNPYLAEEKGEAAGWTCLPCLRKYNPVSKAEREHTELERMMELQSP